MTTKPWGGRFREETLKIVETFTASIGFDRRMYSQDIRGSIAHARMLAKVGIITDAEAGTLVAGLEQVQHEPEGSLFANTRQGGKLFHGFFQQF